MLLNVVCCMVRRAVYLCWLRASILWRVRGVAGCTRDIVQRKDLDLLWGGGVGGAA